ncbi:beta-ketoacyl-ACP synthase II [Streptosporangium sp. G11]|uniref:beta-ketoacyl-ACP synthase II n=1 Tax=Streptosporangium sp. G11 TaxID=3436926 RepID=UPI003EB6F94A
MRSDTPPVSRRRVVVTGLGVRTPAGNDVASLWRTVLAGHSAIGPVERFDCADLPVRFAGEVRDFHAADVLGAKGARQTDRVTHLGFAAAVDAVSDASLGRPDPQRCAVVVGTGLGGIASFHDQVQVFLTHGPTRFSPRAIPMIMPNATAAVIASRLDWTGPSTCVTTACAAGADAIGEGTTLIRNDLADIVIAGGAEAAVNVLGLAAFARMGALSLRNDEPSRASRPFDAGRDGFVLSEGAAFVLLEERDHALRRGARVYGEVAGYGRATDTYHITAPSPGGGGAVRCMRLALADAGLPPTGIGHVNAHGTATVANDASEAAAIGEVFGPASPPVTATKGALGHLIGAAGAVEAVVSLLAMRHGLVPPTANFERPDPDLPVDVVAATPRPVGVRPVLSNSFGFGGQNASLVFTPAD